MGAYVDSMYMLAKKTTEWFVYVNTIHLPEELLLAIRNQAV